MSVFIFGLFFRLTFWSEFQFCRMGITRGVSEMMCCDVRVGDSAGITTRYIFLNLVSIILLFKIGFTFNQG
jgi:hypothetical protein